MNTPTHGYGSNLKYIFNHTPYLIHQLSLGYEHEKYIQNIWCITNQLKEHIFECKYKHELKVKSTNIFLRIIISLNTNNFIYEYV